jgi:phage repressor protein C with HTH and peptisase S24 domain
MNLGDRIRHARKAKGMTQMQLVAAVKKRGGDLSQPQLSAIEKDEVERPGALPEIAAVLGQSAAELLGKPLALRPAQDQPETPVAHYVGAGDEVHIIDGDAPVDYTASPPGFERDRGAACIVRGSSMRPIYDPGDMLFFRHRRDPPASAKDIPERAVIVQIKDGPLYVKRLLPGTRKGRFHLLSINPLTPILQDQPVESFAYIEWVKPRVS